MTEVKFAGHMINEEGIKSDPVKVKSVQDMGTPQNVSDVRRFLRVVNQLGRFIPHLAEKGKPLGETSSARRTNFYGSKHNESPLRSLNMS